MGILNVTPDSFSDGGRFVAPGAALERAHRMIEQGASLIDIGAESTRPGSKPVPEAEQCRRLKPVLAALAPLASRVMLSIDTTRAAVVELAFGYGVGLANDVSAGRDDPALLPVVARLGMSVCLMHMLCTPATMQNNPEYDNVVLEVKQFLRDRLAAAVEAGVDSRRVLLDPGIGFGKSDQHNLQLLRNMVDLNDIGCPILIGTSRKGFIGRITGQPDPADRQFGTAATVAWVVANGVDIVRVHDVAEMRQVVEMTLAIRPRGA